MFISNSHIFHSLISPKAQSAQQGSVRLITPKPHYPRFKLANTSPSLAAKANALLGSVNFLP